MKQVQAKFSVFNKTPVQGSTYNGETKTVEPNPPNSGQVHMCGTYELKPEERENSPFGKSTPSANLSMMILNPVAYDFFEPGADYLVTFEKVEKPEA